MLVPNLVVCTIVLIDYIHPRDLQLLHTVVSTLCLSYKVRDQVLLETPGILRKLSTPCTGPYPVTNVDKNGVIQIQKGIVSERVNICRTSLYDNCHTLLHELLR